MIYKLIVLILAVWVCLYTLSYALYEYKNQNRYGAAAIVSLCLVLTVFVLGMVA